MKLSISINEQTALLQAYNQLDGYEVVVPGVENGPRVVRVPYKLGALRRSIVKNIGALRPLLDIYQETHRSLFKEIFPHLDETQIVKPEDDPVNHKRFKIEEKKILETKDEVDLLRLPGIVMYGDNDFPNQALATLDRHGLIEDAMET